MKKERPKAPDDITQLLKLVRNGQLFTVQQWIADGKRVRFDGNDRSSFCPLYQAVDAGFHSMVEVLLRMDRWNQEELDAALEHAMSNGRLDMVDLLLERGASPQAIDFADVCRSMNNELMLRFLKIGVDPAKENAFARALDDTKARPLLGFYRSHVQDYPTLHPQISLALAEAVKEEKVRWVALLRWAGADPFMDVPESIYDAWDFGEYGGRKAADIVCWSKKPDLLKVLKLRPTQEQAQELLRRASWTPSANFLKELLRVIPREYINNAVNGSCEAVEYCVSHRPLHFNSSYSSESEDGERAGCLEVLLDAGARWNPPTKEIDSIRRSLMKNTPRYLVRVIRLLLYTPNAAELNLIAELCRTSTIRRTIAEADRLLGKDLDKLVAEI